MKSELKYSLYFLMIIGAFVLIIIKFRLTKRDEPTKGKEYSYHELDSIAKEKRIDDVMKKYSKTVDYTKMRDSLITVWKKKYRYKEDEFNGTRFFHHPSSPNYANVNFIFPYIGLDKNGKIYLRTKFQYTAESWLFIRSVKILYDKDPIEYVFNFERDNSGGVIWEYADVPLDEYALSDLERITRSNVCKVRYSGNQYYADRVITQTEKNIIKQILHDYHLYARDLSDEVMSVIENE